MNKIDRASTFRGAVLEKAVGQTKKSQCPQLIVKLKAAEIFDEEEKIWVDYAEYDQGITGYLVLFGKDGKSTLTCQQTQKVFDWTGKSFAELDSIESPAGLQFRVSEDEYEGETRLNVSWIDVYDAEPGGIKKLSPDDLKSLDAKYAKGLQEIRTPAKPAKPVSKAAPGKVEKKPPESKKTVAPPESKKTVAPPITGNPVEKKVDGKALISNKVEAWGAVAEVNQSEKGTGIDDKALGKLWENTIEDIVGSTEEEDITPEQWGEIETALVNAVTVI